MRLSERGRSTLGPEMAALSRARSTIPSSHARAIFSCREVKFIIVYIIVYYYNSNSIIVTTSYTLEIPRMSNKKWIETEQQLI